MTLPDIINAPLDSADIKRAQIEKQRGVENPKVSALLGAAGLNSIDFQLFDILNQRGFSTFVHGSIMQNRIKPSSDIDFTVIGSFDHIPEDLRDVLAPGLFRGGVREHGSIDYVSTSVKSQTGRKISMHISEPSFRENHPLLDQPYAVEYRPGIHAKSGPRNYFLAGANRMGETRLVNFVCESQVLDDKVSTLTSIPQTGKLIIKGNDMIVNGRMMSNIKIHDTIRLRNDDTIDYTMPLDSPEEVMILGLEFDKMCSDTPMYNDIESENRFVKTPAMRCMERIGEYTETDPSAITRRLFGQLAVHWAKVKPNKGR